MIEPVMDKQLLTNLLAKMEVRAKLPQTGRRGPNDPTPMDEATRKQLLEDIERAKATSHVEHEEPQEAENNPQGEKAFLASTPELANLQSALESYVREKRPELITDAPRPGTRGASTAISGVVWKDPKYKRTGQRLLGPFEPGDVRWINSWFAEGMRLFRKKHAFVPRPAQEKPDTFSDEKTRMIIVGDWGSGVARAQKVAKAMRVQLDDGIAKGLQQFVIHLGDVYYSGWGKEYKDRFLKDWPVRVSEKDTIGSFNLNGNHDMFSGGHGFFDVALQDPRFARWQGRSSLFQLHNQRWQLFGLDTSWKDAELAGDQAEWVLSAALPGRKTILLSHHQYCTSYEKVSAKLKKQITPLLKKIDCAAWLWGHEHRCMTFKPLPGIRYPVCLGHGGVPVYQRHKHADAVPAPGTWEYRDFIGSGLEHWGKFGFAVLDFHGDTIDISYMDEDGKLVRPIETIV